ncbi:hypothetical protein GRI55_09525 [Erythrobacter citreus]|uniref:3'-5' exonuclease n=1 Tax=Qipengyuania citrea TaxID=225971 RepID=A0A6I4UAR2_9SPHN|nr:hypothetical protein [Qipengyuania citrea]MDQ0564973.1 hypothetical protein [Qipengyuania citrea]MXP36012.1 hypothetical protein [Qipengyuania citrea]
MAKQTYLALDTEMVWDEHLYEAHRSIDQKSHRHAVAVKKIMAASVFEFSIDTEGRIETGTLASWTEHDWGDERAVIEQLFDFLRAHSETPVLTFGGLATDVPVLLLGSMAHGLALPPQLVDQPGRRGPRPHLDLALQLKGGGRTWSHLSQVLLRMGVPDELVSAKPGVAQPSSAAGWKSLRDHVELDCLLLALAKIAWLVAQGFDGLRFQAAAIGLVAGFIRRRPEHAMVPILADYSVELQSEIADHFEIGCRVRLMST